MSEAWTYAKAGIDLNKHREMHKIAHNIIEELSKKFGIEVYGLKSYTPYVKIGNFEICIHSDGVGTKSIIAENCCKEDVIGWDCVAMNVNDIVVDGFKPLLLSTYVALPEDNVEKFRKIMNGIEKACNYSKMILIGGETAIMPDLLNYVDISCFVLGLRIANPKEVNVNDIVIGIESSGVHANGYTLIRKAVLSKYNLNQYVDELNCTLCEELTKPTHIYSNLILELYEKKLIKKAAHITGGAFTKIKRVLDSGLNIVVDSLPEIPKIFNFIQKVGNVPIEEMFRVFNMGIGMIVITKPENIDEVLKICKYHGFNAWIIGKVIEGSGNIVIRFKNSEIVY